MIGTRINFRPGTVALRLCWIAVVTAPMDASLMFGFSVVPGFDMSWSRLMLIVAVVVTTFACTMTNRVVVGSRIWHSKMLSAWLLWSMASIMWAVEPVTALRSEFKLIVLFVVVWMSSVLCRTGTADQAVLCILCMSLGVALVEEFTGYRLHAMRQHEFAHVLTGFYLNPSHLGGTLALGFPWLMDRVTRETNRRARLVCGLLCVVVLYVVMRTGTKGSLLALAVAGIASVFFTVRNPKVLFKGVLVMIVLCVTGVLLVNTAYIPSPVVRMLKQLAVIFDRTLWYSGEGSFGSRWVVWQDGLELLSRRPVIGLGVGNAEPMLGAMRVDSVAVSAHNLWLQILIEGGVVGWGMFVAAYVGLMFSLIGKLLMRRDFGSASTVLTSLLASVPISITVGNITSLWMFWIVLGIGLAEVANHSKQSV